MREKTLKSTDEVVRKTAEKPFDGPGESHLMSAREAGGPEACSAGCKAVDADLYS